MRYINLTLQAVVVVLVTVAAAVLLVFAAIGFRSVVAPHEVIPAGWLPPCPTEDSTHCYWDASEQGNGLGEDFVSP